MSDPALVCTLPPPALEERRRGLLSQLVDAAKDRHAIPDGMRLRFASNSDTLAMIVRVVDAERQCCRFLRFSITIEADGGPVVLDVTGPAGTREFLEGLFDR